MEMKGLISGAIALIALSTSTASAAEPNLPDNAYRERYHQSATMPDYLAYLSLMQNIRLAEEETGSDANVAHIQTHLSMDETQARAFRDYVLTSYDEMTATNRAVTNRMLCTGNRPKYEVNKAYAVLDVIDDIKDTNLRKHYQAATQDIGKEMAAELVQWLQIIKTGSSHHKYDHRRVFEHTEESVEKVITTACNMIAAYQR